MNTNNQLFSISIDPSELKRIADEAKKSFLDSARQKANGLTRSLLADGKDYYQREKGAAYLILQEKLEGQILEEATQKFAEDYIKQNWNRHLSEALDKAMQHKANKIAFDITKDLSKGS